MNEISMVLYNLIGDLEILMERIKDAKADGYVFPTGIDLDLDSATMDIDEVYSMGLIKRRR